MSIRLTYFFKVTALIIVCGLLVTSCTVKKRSYRSGYYIEWNKKASHVSSSAQANHKENHSKRTVASEISSLQPEELVSAEKATVLTKKKERINIFNADTCADVITMRTGDEINGKVIEVNEKQIKYKRCDNLEGPLVTVNKSDVFRIKYANGSQELFKDEKPTVKSPENKSSVPSGPMEPKVHPMAIASILCSTVGVFIAGVGPIIGIILGTRALREIKMEPDRYTGKGLSIAGIVLGAIWCVLMVLVIILVIAAIFFSI